MCSLGGAGKQAMFFLLQTCQMCDTFWKRHIMLLPIFLEEVLCEWNVVEVWEEMV